MNRKILIVLVLTMVTLALTLPLASASGWAQFHGNVKHTGYSTSNAPVTNHTAWISDDIGAHVASSVTIADGQVFVYCRDYLVCLDEYTGEVLWNVSVERTPESTACCSWVTPTYHSGMVFLSANEICCFDAVDGSRIWTFEPSTGKGAVNGGCTIVEDMVFASDWDGSHYYCLNAADGTEIWNFTVAGNAQSTPAVSIADDRVFFGSYANICEEGGVAYCVNITTGVEIWNFTTDNSVCGSVTIGDGVVYFTEYNFYGDGALYALYSENGAVKWNETIERSDSTPALVDGRLYVSGGYGDVDNKYTDLLTYCFDASTGDLLWNTTVADEIGDWKCSPACADGMVFAGRPKPNSMDFEGTYALNAITGEIVWSYPEGGASPAVADGMVFTIGGGRVYAFGSSIQDWAQFHYDTANTGNSPADAPDTSHTKWVSEDIGAVPGSQAIIAGDLVFVYANVTVYGLDRDTGAELWSAPIPGDIQGFGSWTSSAYSNDAIFVSAGYNLTKIDVNGNKLQEIAFPDDGYSCNGGPTVADGMVFVGSGSTNYYAFDESNLNNVIWTYPVISGTAVSTPAVADDKVVFGEMSWSGSSNLFCVNKYENASAPGTTDTNWVTPLTGGIGGSASIDAANNRVYVATFINYTGDAGMLYAVDFTTGDVVWNRTITYSDSTPTISGDYIYVSGSVNAQGMTYCFDSTGTLQWTVPCGSWTMSPTVADGKLFTGSVGIWGADGICVFNAMTGDPIWQYEHAGSSPSIAKDGDGNGMVVSIGVDGMVYVFGDVTGMMGDVNHDGSVTTADAVIALRMAVGAVPPNGGADVDHDGAVTSLDALMILQVAAGAITI